MLQIFSELFVKLLAWAIPFTLRKAYPAQRIADLIKIRVSADSEGIEYWGGEVPQARAWLTITNLSPFHIELDRAFGAFSYGAELEKFTYLQKEKIPPATEKLILIETSLSKERAAIVDRLRGSGQRPGINFNAHILCRVHDLDVRRSLETTHHRLLNFTVVG